MLLLSDTIYKVGPKLSHHNLVHFLYGKEQVSSGTLLDKMVPTLLRSCYNKEDALKKNQVE